MAQGVDEARKQRELTKQTLATNLNRLEARVRAELDWKARLRRDGPRIAAIGAVVVVGVGAVLIIRSRLKRDDEEPETAPTLEDVTAELCEIRKHLEKQNGKSSSMVQKALLRGIAAAGSAGGTMLAKQMLRRQAPAEHEEAAAARGG
ncbi:MAG: hypothetical protein ABR498_09905 [Candidatus Dormibacteria bacterium]